MKTDDNLFDRLVDSELTAEERRRLLESLDARPDGWRRCALAFLEAQSWRETLAELAHGVAVGKPKTSGPSVRTMTQTHSAKTVMAPRTAWRHSAAWLAMAASLLLAFLLGWMQRNSGVSTNSTVNQAFRDGQVAEGTPVAPPETGQNSASRADAMTLWVLDDSGKTHPVRVPLMDAAPLERALGTELQPSVSADVQKQLQQRGYQVQTKRRFAPLWLENGRPMVLPVEDTKIIPVGY